MLEVSDAVIDFFEKDKANKNFLIHFKSGRYEDITNKDIVSESVKLTESLCSQDTLKFGLCEASIFECDVFGIGNIKDEIIEVSQYLDIDGEMQPIPYGVFIVNSCKRNPVTDVRKIIANGYMAEKNMSPSLLEKEVEQIPYKFDYYMFRAKNYLVSSIKKEFLDYSAEEVDYITNAIPAFPSSDNNTSTIDIGNIRLKVKKVYIGMKNEFDESDILDFEFPDIVSELITKFYELVPLEYQIHQFKELLSHVYYRFGYAVDSSSSQKFYTTKAFKILDFESGEYSNNEYLVPADMVRPMYDSKGFYIWNHVAIIECPIGFSVYEKISDSLYKPIVTYGDSGEYRDTYKPKLYKIKMNNLDLWDITSCNDFSSKFYRSSVEKFFTLPLEIIKKTKPAEIVKNILELNGLFGKFDRNGKFRGISLSNLFPYPSDTLYPSEDVYPEGCDIDIWPANCQFTNFWYDDYYVKPIGKIQAIYKSGDNTTAVAEYIVDEHAENVYVMSDNIFLLNNIWSNDEVVSILESVYKNIAGISYYPMQATIRGLPYAEAGDSICFHFHNGEENIRSLILRRELSGNQSLSDNISASGNEFNEELAQEPIGEE